MHVNKKEMKNKIKRRKLYRRILSDLKEKQILVKAPNVKSDSSELNLGQIENKIHYYENQLKRM